MQMLMVREGAKKRVLECCSRVVGLSFSDWHIGDVMRLMMLAMVKGDSQFDAEEYDHEVDEVAKEGRRKCLKKQTNNKQ